MDTLKVKALVVETATLLCILLFVYAAASKLLDFNTFQNQLGQSPLLSAYADVIVWLVPLSEIAIAVLLALPRWKILGFHAFFILMFLFTAYIVIILNFTSHTPCSCGGVLEDMGWTEHLIFNILFLLLSGAAAVLLSHNRHKTAIGLAVSAVASIVLMVLVHWGSEREMRQNNAFIRRYHPHALEELGSYELDYNSYYLAGISDKAIYLGNHTAPLSMRIFDRATRRMQDRQVVLDRTALPFRRVMITVQPPYFYVADGTVPVLFRGNTSDWKASAYPATAAYFDQFVPIDSTAAGITTTSAVTRSNALGLLGTETGEGGVMLNTELLKARSGNKFENDGLLLWNGTHQRFLYTYFYKNRYAIADRKLEHGATGKTIDTISQPILDVAHYTREDQYKRGANSVLVNRQSATYGHYLHVHSDRLGRYENDRPLRRAAIIDVYDIRDNTYAFSFYLFHQEKQKISGFLVHKDLLVAVVADQLWIYRLKPEYFDTGNNAKHTAQYQEKGRTPVKNSRP